MEPIPDGTYDVFIVDSETVSSDTGDSMRIEATIISGPLKGEVVGVRATNFGKDPIDLLGMPGTLTVTDGVPRIVLD